MTSVEKIYLDHTLDAIHLATAMELGAELHVLVAYDARLLGAARGASVPTLTPV